jgi:S1-C subfamily serine protease
MQQFNERTYRVEDGEGGFVDPHTCIFPIMKETPDGHTRLVGTGFFITMLGHFVTAKHVIFDAYDPEAQRQTGTLHAVHFVEGSSVLVRHITEVSYHNVSDVAVGKMDFHVINSTGLPFVNRVPRFTVEIPAIGSGVVTFAYPESDRIFTRGESAAFRPNFYAGELLFHNDQPRDRVMVTWPHFGTSINLRGGASGGPVFDEQGRVIGINCVGGYEDLSYIARAQELLDLNVPQYPLPVGYAGAAATVRELAQLRHIVFEPLPDAI